ncbi:CGNR zinc finger domain-containing protein [Streptomyces sp. NPDC001780]
MAARDLVLDLALTIRHDGRGGVTDDLTTPGELARWVLAHADQLAPDLDAAVFAAGDAELADVRELRAAIRALFARAVRPEPPSPADARRLMPSVEALRRVNAAAAAVPTVPRLDWPEGAVPAADSGPARSVGERAALSAALARAAIAFLAGPDRDKLRACHAPRCVRYFLKEHPRQEWCRPACGNRARVARHHERHRVPDRAQA